ncbi:hypothetical protein SAMN05660860_00684 [Geoalkalibacter ferrihydriticus]|uniref:Sigma-54 factor interaction domain-containing protein n=3 Tax=Geoalkalibacter ferrihydriticus TaxID=392333 RepID=A0A0C2HVX5_9BACT|nr:hypothetical protein GFER_07270 [Geoalkalibacter ferrihydriticus DSM 17813]SDL45884.1 hypothetical protein SAMN05660860_00684 [Geoalkalibacter ferrihydriticus]
MDPPFLGFWIKKCSRDRTTLPRLPETFLDVFRKHQGKPQPGLSQAALDQLLAYDWPGNIRELRNLLEYAAITSSGELIQPKHLCLQQQDEVCHEELDRGRISLNFNFSPEEFSLAAVNRQVMDWALAQWNNNKSSAARLLKASRKLFY